MIDDLLRDLCFADQLPLCHASFGRAAASDRRPITCLVSPADVRAAEDYLAILGSRDAEIVSRADLDDLSILGSRELADRIPLVLLRATRPNLHDIFFRHPRVALFCDHLYRPSATHESPDLFTIGTSNHVAQELASASSGSAVELRAARRRAARDHFGPAYFDDELVWAAMHSPGVQTIRVHCLGPRGTNISQAAQRFVEQSAPFGKSELLVHPRKVEPLAYAELAARDVQLGVIPLHMECAVFYDLERLFLSRPSEIIFAAHQYMHLDDMQLAARSRRDLHGRPISDLRVASHPSPRALCSRLLDAGATYMQASSNADAAHLVQQGDADLCITTESARRLTDLELVHRFGRPAMLFTLGTPLNAATLRTYAAPVEAAIPTSRSRHAVVVQRELGSVEG